MEIEQNEIDTIPALKAEKQKNNVDVLVTIETDKGQVDVIFENKMWSTVHGDQLKRYRQKFNRAIKFIYLKLGYIHDREREEVTKAGYSIINAEDLYRFLHGFDEVHQFIQEFNEYLDDWFVTPQRMMDKKFEQNKIEELKDASFQQFVMGKVSIELLKNGFDKEDILFKVGSNNDGSPWTQLNFSFLDKVYGEYGETLFFRIDRRSGRYYLRVNLYSRLGKDDWPLKRERLFRLREVAKLISVDSNLKYGNVHDRARYETEVLILFFNDTNEIKKVVSESSIIANQLRDAHQNLLV
ncbi:PD-(D/E)XK nuclease family protein [Pleurocapsales cyanobacterium LEGE 10410]|nr:PD-(D/E)XK nuclease family protein [Pleurocapsales cyanobacterium LEGE 10410]